MNISVSTATVLGHPARAMLYRSRTRPPDGVRKGVFAAQEVPAVMGFLGQQERPKTALAQSGQPAPLPGGRASIIMATAIEVP
jgi:hypothetical protein